MSSDSVHDRSLGRDLAIKVLLSLKLGGVLQRITGREPEWPY